MTRSISCRRPILIALFAVCMFVGIVGCNTSSEAVKLETPDGVDWAALEKQQESLASEMNRDEK